MQKKTVLKSKFSQINNERLCFADSITSLPPSHPHLQGLIDFKTKQWAKDRVLFLEGKRNLIRDRKYRSRTKWTLVLIPSGSNEPAKQTLPQSKE